MPGKSGETCELHHQAALDFDDLVEFQFHWGCATEDDDRSLDSFAFEVDLCNLAVEVCEWTAGDSYVIADLHVDNSRLLALDAGDSHLTTQNLANLSILHGNRLLAGSYILRHAGRFANDPPRVVIENHFNEDVARI